jgi:hypothetical protein
MTRGRLLFAACVAIFILASGSTAVAHEVTQSCTPGFYKNHPQFITGGQCLALTPTTTVATLFPGVETCVGALTIQQLLEASTSVCGPGSTLAGAEVILLRQAIARILNAVHSGACDVVAAVITATNNAITAAIATNDKTVLTSLASTYDALNNAGACTVGD